VGLQFYSTNADGTLGAVAVSKSQNPRQDSVRGASDRRYIGQGNGRGRFGLSRSDMVRCGQDRSRMSFRRQCERVSVARESQRSIAWDRVPWKDRWSQMMPCPDEIGRCGSREAKGRARTRRSPQSAIFHRSKPINEVQRKCSISDMPNIYARNLADRMRNRRWERRAGRPNLLRFKPSFVLIHAVIQMDTISQFVRSEHVGLRGRSHRHPVPPGFARRHWRSRYRRPELNSVWDQ